MIRHGDSALQSRASPVSERKAESWMICKSTPYLVHWVRRRA